MIHRSLMKAAYWLLCIVCCVLLANCKNEVHRQNPVQVSIPTHQDSLVADSIRRDSAWCAFLKHIEEPDIRNVNIEIYRFFVFGWFTPTFAFRIQNDSVGNYTFVTKAILPDHGGCGQYKMKRYKVKCDSVIECITQKLTTKEWQHYRALMDRSYTKEISQFPNKLAPKNCGDAGSLMFERRICLENSGKLQYQSMAICYPFDPDVPKSELDSISKTCYEIAIRSHISKQHPNYWYMGAK